MSFRKVKGHGFDPWLGHMPRFWVWSLAGPYMRGNWSNMMVYDYVSRAKLRPDYIILGLKHKCGNRTGMINLEARKEASDCCARILQPWVYCYLWKCQKGKDHVCFGHFNCTNILCAIV